MGLPWMLCYEMTVTHIISDQTTHQHRKTLTTLEILVVLGVICYKTGINIYLPIYTVHVYIHRYDNKISQIPMKTYVSNKTQR